MLGMPMIGHCYHRTRLAPGLDATYVATCDEPIANYVARNRWQGGDDRINHNRATTRTAEHWKLSNAKQVSESIS